MESIQLAQMLADLSDLNAAEPQAAIALVTANKTTIHPADTSNELKPPEQRHHHRVASASAAVSRTASPSVRFDKFGRKILTPPLTRTNSSQGSPAPGTPRRDFDHEDDIDRASTLMALYEIRAKIKQQDNTSLIKAREKVNALVARQQAQVVEKRDITSSPINDPRHPRFTYPRAT